jgi:hypothetical protein
LSHRPNGIFTHRRRILNPLDRALCFRSLSLRPSATRSAASISLKERISAAYYSSEKGMKQLGFTGQMAHGGFPGCTHPGGHASSD